MDTYNLVVSLFASIGFASITYLIAKKREGNKIIWSILGFIFGPFAIPFCLFVTRKRKDKIGKQATVLGHMSLNKIS